MDVKFYFAPLEGITGYVFRDVYERHFGGIEAYYSPFISTTQKKKLRNKEWNDIEPAHNQGCRLVPQLMSSQAEDFVRYAQTLEECGYDQVNLNLGCPSRTVVSKGKGSGFLERTVALERFLEQVCRESPIPVSVKTRLGRFEVDEFRELARLYSRYPLAEVIVHPRIQPEFYTGTPHWDVLEEAMPLLNMPVCLNGDIRTPQDIEALRQRFPQSGRMMIGRGLLSYPDLIRRYQGGPAATRQEIYEYIRDLCEQYRRVLSGDIPVLFKMKEIWSFLIDSFEDGSRWKKKIHKCQKLTDYERIVEELFATLPLAERPSGKDGCRDENMDE